ncbi:lysoplasmalogenase family protein [Flavobacterium sp.]|uniref:lysoplasmalogenase family protein n=1 Tax=Flavobacterium sp. TaxID=239 RepID=UPI00261ADF01|nr:lysoplasmalogenase family protein [Flavobacterium sp.]
MMLSTKQIALGLYVFCSILAVIATIVDDDLMILLVKPAVIPAILYYYLTIKKTKINWFFISVLLLNFIGDTIVLLEIKDQTLIIMIPYFISYLLLLRFSILDLRKMRIIKSGILLAALIFGFLMYVLYELVQMFADTNPELIVPVIVYGIVLGLFGCIAVYCYYAKITAFTFYLLMFVITSIVSDVFYMLFHFLFQIPFLNYFEFATQLVSYYFVVKYFVSRKND